MRKISAYATQSEPAQASLTLTFERRSKMRARIVLDDGGEAMLDLPRGRPLQDGDKVKADDGLVIQVHAASESLSVATSADPLLLARACYHLGNRHVALEIGPNRVAYLTDHVLDDLVRHLGLTLTLETAPFSPENGAYDHHQHG